VIESDEMKKQAASTNEPIEEATQAFNSTSNPSPKSKGGSSSSSSSTTPKRSKKRAREVDEVEELLKKEGLERYSRLVQSFGGDNRVRFAALAEDENFDKFLKYFAGQIPPLHAGHLQTLARSVKHSLEPTILVSIQAIQPPEQTSTDQPQSPPSTLSPSNQSSPQAQLSSNPTPLKQPLSSPPALPLRLFQEPQDPTPEELLFTLKRKLEKTSIRLEEDAHFEKKNGEFYLRTSNNHYRLYRRKSGKPTFIWSKFIKKLT
jgi:hypothetical protein